MPVLTHVACFIAGELAAIVMLSILRCAHESDMQDKKYIKKEEDKCEERTKENL